MECSLNNEDSFFLSRGMIFSSAFAVDSLLNAWNSLCNAPIILIRFQKKVKWEDVLQYQTL